MDGRNGDGRRSGGRQMRLSEAGEAQTLKKRVRCRDDGSRSEKISAAVRRARKDTSRLMAHAPTGALHVAGGTRCGRLPRATLLSWLAAYIAALAQPRRNACCHANGCAASRPDACLLLPRDVWSPDSGVKG